MKYNNGKFSKSFLCSFLILIYSVLPNLFHNSILDASTLPCDTYPYVIVTIPKSGTHLILKLVFMFSKNPFRGLAIESSFKHETHTFPPHQHATLEKFVRVFPKLQNESLVAHLNHGKLMEQFTNLFTHYKRILMIRDPRDICISTVFYIEDELSQILGPTSSFDERLLLIIQSEPHLENSLFNIKKEAQEALAWMKDPLTTICRFENLCGPQGGGSLAAQKAEIIKVANTFHIQLNDDQLEKMAKNLWGSSHTFRKGQIGTWKMHFTPKHKEAFKERMGDILIQMGYETSNDW